MLGHGSLWHRVVPFVASWNPHVPANSRGGSCISLLQEVGGAGWLSQLALTSLPTKQSLQARTVRLHGRRHAARFTVERENLRTAGSVPVCSKPSSAACRSTLQGRRRQDPKPLPSRHEHQRSKLQGCSAVHGCAAAAQRLTRAPPFTVQSPRSLTCRCQLRSCKSLLGRKMRKSDGNHADLPFMKNSLTHRNQSNLPHFLQPALKMASLVQVLSTTTRWKYRGANRS